MSETRENLLTILKEAQTQEGLLWQITRLNLASLPPDVEDAAYRCAILHWFNPDILAAILQAGSLAHTSRVDTLPEHVDAQAIYSRLQNLSCTEIYPERGYNFHDKTREVMLAYLWREENDFYRQVSASAADFFVRDLETEAGTPWEEVVEWSYHLLIANEPMAVVEIDSLIVNLSDQGLGGYCDALIQAIREHARADRLSSTTLTWLHYWEVIAAYLNTRYAEVQQIAGDLLAAADEFVSPLQKAHVRRHLADSLRLTGRFDEAKAVYQALLKQLKEIGSIPELELDAFWGLGKIAETQGNLHKAETFYQQALETAVRALALETYSNEDGEMVQAVGLLEDEALPPGLRLHDPEGWFPWYDLLISETTSTDEAELAEEGESPYPPDIPIYLVETAEINATGPEELEPGQHFALVADVTLAELWLNLGEVYHILGLYDRAAASGRLAGRMFADLNSAGGLQRVFQLRFSLGVTTVDLELMKISSESQHQLLQYAIEQGDEAAELGALLGLAAIYWHQSEYARARERYEAALHLARDLEDQNSMAVALENLASLDLVAGDVETAETRVQQALELYRQIEHREGEARLLTTMGRLELERHQTETAGEYYQKALNLFKELHVSEGEIAAYQGLGSTALARERITEARLNFAKARKIARRLAMPSREIDVLLDLARLYTSQEQPETARTSYEEALSIARRTRHVAREADILRGLGSVAVAQEQFQEANDLYDAAEEIYNRLNQPAGMLDVLFGRLYLYEVQQDGEQVVRTAEQALAHAERLGDRPMVIQALLRIYEGLKLQGKYDQLLGTLDRALALAPQSVDALAARAEILCDFAQYEAAVATFDNLILLDSENSWAFQMKGWALSNLGQERAQECLTAYETSVALDDDNYWAHKGVADAYHLLGEAILAAEKYQWLVNKLLAQEESSRDQDLLAWCYYRLGEYQKAVDTYEQVMERTEDRLFNQFDYALSLMCNQEYQRSLQEYRQGIEWVSQRQPPGRRGFLYVAIDDLQEALVTHPSLAERQEARLVMGELQSAWQAAHNQPEN